MPFSSTSGFDLPDAALEAPPERLAGPPDAGPQVSWWFAAIQVFLVCGIPTQLLIVGGLLLARTPMGTDGSRLTLDSSQISLQFFALSALLDTAFIAVLIRIFLLTSGEPSHRVLLGDRRIGLEMGRGLLYLPALWLLVIGVVYLLSTIFPSLHNVPTNPYAAYMDTPLKAGVFIVVVVIAGGVREELQRAFILHRFQHLGGVYVGLALFSAAFGLMHAPQGWDAAIAVGLLGVIWGLMYIRRRSVVAPMVSHAGFDVVQVLQQVLLHSLGK